MRAGTRRTLLTSKSTATQPICLYVFYIYIYMHIYIFVYVYIYICIYICVCVCIRAARALSYLQINLICLPTQPKFYLSIYLYSPLYSITLMVIFSSVLSA